MWLYISASIKSVTTTGSLLVHPSKPLTNSHFSCQSKSNFIPKFRLPPCKWKNVILHTNILDGVHSNNFICFFAVRGALRPIELPILNLYFQILSTQILFYRHNTKYWKWLPLSLDNFYSWFITSAAAGIFAFLKWCQPQQYLFFKNNYLSNFVPFHDQTVFSAKWHERHLWAT